MSGALVLSAGAMFGAWQVGVWKSLHGRFQPDLVVGASAGALNGWAIAGGCTPEELAASWMDPRVGAILHPGLHRSGILRPAGLYEHARELFARFQPKVPFALTMIEVPRLRLRVVRDSEITWRHLAASCSVPLCFPPVLIEGRHYVDGGLLGALPLWAAEQLGARSAVAANALNTLPFRMMRTVVRPRRPSPKMRITLIEPSPALGTLREAVVWSPENIKRWIEQGERDANRTVTSITI